MGVHHLLVLILILSQSSNGLQINLVLIAWSKDFQIFLEFKSYYAESLCLVSALLCKFMQSSSITPYSHGCYSYASSSNDWRLSRCMPVTVVPSSPEISKKNIISLKYHDFWLKKLLIYIILPLWVFVPHWIY